MMRLFLIAIFIFIWIQPSYAAFKSVNDDIDPQQTWNPQPLSDDIVLPMPCGLYLALRAVDVPAGALIRDRTFQMGITNSQNQDRQIYERQFPGHIAAPFTVSELPAKWKQQLNTASSRAHPDAWYFIGKYEISHAQWDAVMNALNVNGTENSELCPRINATGANLPVSGISWFEAQEFLNKYNAWLVKNHVEQLPSFSGTSNIAFFRLPTEEEWEYAARGGSHVPPEWWADQDIFPFAEGKTLKDYAVTSLQGAQTKPLGIGSRTANPLGIHDTAGNIGEMVDGFFRLSIADMANGQVIRRLHGAAGGILVKGGSFRSQPEATMPGSREEVPLYTKTGPARPQDLGLRIVLAGLNIPNAQRLTDLRKEAGSQKFTPELPKAEMTGSTPLEMIESLAAGAEASLQPALHKLRDAIKDQESAQTAEDLKNLEQSFRSLLYQAETLRAFGFRYSSASQQINKVKKILGENLSNEDRATAKRVLATGEKDLKDYLQSLKMGANYYKNTLSGVYQRDARELDRLFKQAQKEYGSGTIFDEHMRQNIDILKKYIETARKNGISSLETKSILRGILPEKHFSILPL